jgi:hypothetical protein
MEAFLLKNVDEYVAIVKEFGDLDCWISSNLSLPPDRYLPSIISARRLGICRQALQTGWLRVPGSKMHDQTSAGKGFWVELPPAVDDEASTPAGNPIWSDRRVL